MVAVTKWIVLGLGILAATFFFKEAAGSSLTGTLQRTGLAGQSLGTGIAATGAGVGEAGVRLLDPFFSLADLFSKFGNLFGGNGEVITNVQSPLVQTTGGVVYVVFDDCFSIYQNQSESGGVLVGGFEGGVVLDFSGVEDDDVGSESFAEFSPVF